LILPRPLRRILTPVLLGVAVAVVGLATIASVAGLLEALVDKRARLLRVAIIVGVYAALEVVVVVLMLAITVLRLVRIVDESADLRAVGWALGSFLGAARAVCGFRVELAEPSSLAPFEGPEPVLVLARHGGIGDSFALAHLLISRYQRRPRVVLKGVLLWDPMLDVALTRMGACWMGPSSGGAGRQAIGHLAARMGPGEALLLFPEGQNWTPRRRTSAIARLWKSGRPEAVKAAALMEHVLPPKSGGVLACLEARPQMPVVIMAHTGLDRITSPRALWRALPFEDPMRLRWWPAAPAPADEDGRLRWLTAEWAVVDQWIDASEHEDPPSHVGEPAPLAQAEGPEW
jgi:1-acyl-sn-glycerol-3-phosphate acyltransferase